MTTLTKEEQIIYDQVLDAISKLKTGEDFCLDKSFYENNGITATTTQRQKIGKFFKQQVACLSGVEFDKCYHGCDKCGYKDRTNRVRYKKL